MSCYLKRMHHCSVTNTQNPNRPKTTPEDMTFDNPELQTLEGKIPDIVTQHNTVQPFRNPL